MWVCEAFVGVFHVEFSDNLVSDPSAAIASTLAVAGVALGLLALTRVLSFMLYQVKPSDPMTFGSVALLLLAVAFLACWRFE